jgi:hypothetical protein
MSNETAQDLDVLVKLIGEDKEEDLKKIFQQSAINPTLRHDSIESE